MNKGNSKALLPIGVFLVLYLGLGITFEYILKIPMGFYNIPIVVAFLISLFTAVIQNRKLSFDEKLTIMGGGVGDKNIITMLLIFLIAGIFVGVTGRDSANSVAYFLLSVFPAKFSVLVLFIIASFISVAMGTSVGTITLITPIAISLSNATALSAPLCVATVIGGAMFGDNLSFISDTTIAATGGQGCSMKDKFKENFPIALPAAILCAVLIFIITASYDLNYQVPNDYNLVQIIPYIVVLIGGIVGINVFLVLIIGIISGSVITLITTATTIPELLSSMGSGASGMFETAIIAVLVSAICALVRKYGGFESLLYFIKKIFRGRRAGMLGIGLLVGLMDIATANNTVAIVMANPIAREMSEDYGISKEKTASVLDTFSCIFQGIIPYGAQMLVAISAAKELGVTMSAFQVIPLLFYPFLLLLSSLIFILFDKKREV